MQNPLRIQPRPKLYLPTDPNRPSVYRLGAMTEDGQMVQDGRTGYRASELGRCIRALTLCKLGYQPEPFDQSTLKIMEMGNILEPEAAAWFQDTEGGVVQRQVRIQLDVQDKQGVEVAVVGGVSDGLWFVDKDDLDPTKFDVIQNTSAKYDTETIVYHSKLKPESFVWGLEIKAPKKSTFNEARKNGPREGYKVQMSIYWHAYEEMLGVKLMGFWFVMVCQEDTSLKHAHCYTKPFYSKQHIIDRILHVENLAAAGEDSADCDTKDFFCKYWRFHKDDVAEAKAYDASMTKLAQEYVSVSRQLKELEAKQKDLKFRIDSEMKGRDKVRTDDHTLYYSSRQIVNIKKLLQDNPEAAKTYTKFDSNAALKAKPEWKELYSTAGERFLTVRELRPQGRTKTSRRVGALDLTDEQMDAVLNGVGL